MPTPKKNKDGQWETIAYVGKDSSGRRKYKHLIANSKPELLQKLRQLEDETPATIDAGSLTVRQALAQYIARRENELSPSTKADYMRHPQSAFPQLMDLKISQLTDEVVQKAIDDYAKDHAAKTVINRWSLISSAVEEAKKNWSVSVRRPSVRRKRLEMPDDGPLLKLFEEIENTPLEIPVLLAAVCGLRRSEICALDLARDIDYDRCLIHIDKALVIGPDNAYTIKDTKTTAGERTVPCPKWVIEKLAEARNNPSYKPYKPNTITTHFTPIAKRCGVNCTFHGLRHYYASIMSALGVPDQYAMERMGHTTRYMLSRYQEYIKSKEAEVNEDLMNALDKLNPNTRNYQAKSPKQPK